MNNQNWPGYQMYPSASIRDREWEREVYLKNHILRNDEALFKPVKVRCIRPFKLDGRVVTMGESVSIEKHLANSLKGIKVEIL